MIPTTALKSSSGSSRQEWSDGKVGTVGTSYPGGTQHAAGRNESTSSDHNDTHRFRVETCARQRNATRGAFRAAVPELDSPLRPGAPNARAALWPQPGTTAGTRREWPAWSVIMPADLPIRFGTTPLRVVPEYEAWLIEAMRSGPESPFWHKKGISVVDHVGDYADVPVLHVTGWYDSWARQVSMNYDALSHAKRSPQRLVIGPWTQGGQNSNVAGEVEFTREAGIDLLAFRLRWYDRWMKNDKSSVDDDPPVLLYIMGTGDDRRSPAGRLNRGGFWRAEREWPLARAQATPLFLGADGTLARTPPDAAARPAQPTPLTRGIGQCQPIGGNILVEPGADVERRL